MLRSLGFVVLSLVASTAFAERTALQKHADFFDGNGNNVVTVPETYDGLRRLASTRFAQALLRSPLTSDLAAAPVPRGTNPTTST